MNFYDEAELVGFRELEIKFNNTEDFFFLHKKMESKQFKIHHY